MEGAHDASTDIAPVHETRQPSQPKPILKPSGSFENSKRTSKWATQESRI